MFYYIDFHVGAYDHVRRFVFMIDAVLPNDKYRMQCVSVSEENQGIVDVINDVDYIAKGTVNNLVMKGDCFGDADWDLDLQACVNFPALPTISIGD
jgi:hypothetical protein